jgi:hypothetical protein
MIADRGRDAPTATPRRPTLIEIGAATAVVRSWWGRAAMMAVISNTARFAVSFADIGEHVAPSTAATAVTGA